MLEAVPWGNPTYGISGGAAGNVAYGGTVNPPRNRKGGAGNPPPKGARASALPDKVVQGALREVLEAVYEQDFVECSYGFRPGRSAHDAIRALNGAVYQGKVSWILEADIESFFDSLDRTGLEEMLRIRVADGSLRRLVGKCVRVGVLDGEERTEPERGTPQGSGLSPLLGNLYLHHTLDVWFEREVKPCLGGEAVLVRYCDDFVIDSSGARMRSGWRRCWASGWSGSD